MHVTRYYIAEILQDVCKRMSDVTGNVFPEHRPSATQEQMDEMIVVSLPVSIDDQNAWQKTTMRIEMFAKNVANGQSATLRLQEILNGVTAKFPLVDRRYSATSPKLMLKGDDGLGFTVWNIQAKLIVNTTDSYV